MITKLKSHLEETLAVCEKATPGPWVLDMYEEGFPSMWLTKGDREIYLTVHDLNLIEKARTALPAHTRALLIALRDLELIRHCAGREAWEFAENSIIQISAELGLDEVGDG
jgi:hypothetical protein